MKTYLIALASGLFLCANSWAISPYITDYLDRWLDRWSLGGGTYTRFHDLVQTDAVGSKNSFEFNPTIMGSLGYDLSRNWILTPTLGFVFSETTRDPLISKMTYFLNFNFAYKLSDTIHLRTGAGFAMTRISSDGGTQTLNNGTGTDSFFMPETASTSRNFTAIAGLEFFINKNFSLITEIHLYNPLDDLNKSEAFFLALNFTSHKEDWEH